MSQMPNVVIVMSRCSRSRELYGMRFEEQARGAWVADWAFPVRENVAKKEGYDQAEIKGSFSLNSEYPGCSYCRAMTVIHCASCDKLSCYDGSSATARCGWCGLASQVSSGTLGGLKAGGDL